MTARAKPKIMTPNDRAALWAELQEALSRFYMGAQSFSYAFNTEPHAALEVFDKDPARFGRLRSYVGPISLTANKLRVRRLARKLMPK
jgi:hypothetical protein